MSAVVGLGAAGIEAGGLIAGMQAAAATGGSVALVAAPLAAAVFVGGVATAVGVAAAVSVGQEEMEKLRKLPSKPNGVDASAKYIVLVHDFDTVHAWSVNKRTDAGRVLSGIKLRHFAVKLNQPSVIYADSKSPWHVSWTEFGHGGSAPWVDDDMRRFLLKKLAN